MNVLMLARAIAACLSAVAVFAFSSPTSAQSSASSRFVERPQAFAATLSPNGGSIALVRQVGASQVLTIVDLETQRGRALQQIREEEGQYEWVAWKGDDRVIYGVRLKAIFEGRRRTGTMQRSEDREVDFFRVMSIGADGSGFAQMFEGQMRSTARSGGSNALLDILRGDPEHVLLLSADQAGVGVWRASVRSGRAEQVVGPSQNVSSYVTDGAGNAVIRMEILNGLAGYRIFRRAAGAEAWTFVLEARRAATATNSPDFNVLGPGPGLNQVYVLARVGGQNLASLYLYNTENGEMGEPLQQPVAADASPPLVDGLGRQLIATCEFWQRLNCRARDPAMQRHLSAIDSFFEHRTTVNVIDISDDGNRWLLRAEGPMEPGGFYLYDRGAARISAIADVHPGIGESDLSPTEILNYTARDGAPLWAYVTARAGVMGARPMVVLPHGGPEVRDYYGYDAFAQFLASRGYVVVQPNFRGSFGQGRDFADAGRAQWGRRMQDDVTDAVRHLIQTGVADPARICIVGASYGGYAALAGAALTPDLYRCAVSISGVSDLSAMLRAARSGVGGSQAMDFQYWSRSIGDPDADRAALLATSPSEQAAAITADVLLIHGDHDETVPIRQSEIMADALRDARKPAHFVRIPDEGHTWAEWDREHLLTLYNEVDVFLARHLQPAN